MRRPPRLAPIAPLVLIGALGAPGLAHAGPSDNATSDPWEVDVGLGPMINLEGGGALGRTALDFRYHFRGGDVGPALGAQLPFHFRERIFGLKVGPIFGWDFRVAEPGNLRVYVGPLVSTGYAMTTVTGVAGATGHNWYLTLGGQVRMMFTDRVGAFLRPIDFDVWAGEGGATGFWSLTLGLALSF